MHCEWEILRRGSEWFREYLEPSFEKTKSMFNMIPRFAEVPIQMSNRIISFAFSDFVCCCDEMPSIWLEIGSKLIKGLDSKYRALNRTELKLQEHRNELSQPSYTIEPSRTFNLNARCSIERLNLAWLF